MRCVSRLVSSLFLTVGCALMACSPASPPTVTATVQRHTAPAPTQLAIPATPELIVEIRDLNLVFDPKTGSGDAIGLLGNATEWQVRDVMLRVSITDASGSELATQAVALEQKFLGPGEVSPFRAHFVDGLGAEAAQVQVVGYERASFSRVGLIVEEIERFHAQDGTLAILGRITNPGPRQAAVHRLTFIARDSENQPVGLANLSIGLTSLAPGQSSPFLVEFDDDPPIAESTAYIDALAIAAPPEPPFSFPVEPRVLSDEQSNRFVLGSLKNEASSPKYVSFLLILRMDDRLVGLSRVDSPLPVAGGEQLAFSVGKFFGPDFSQIASDRPEADWEIEVLLDTGLSSDAEVVRKELDLSISGAEKIGSSIFLRGQLTNSEEQAVLEKATVLVALRSTEGELVSAGWQVVRETLPAGETAQFVLPLRIPAGIDLPDLEFDLRAFGVLP